VCHAKHEKHMPT